MKNNKSKIGNKILSIVLLSALCQNTYAQEKSKDTSLTQLKAELKQLKLSYQSKINDLEEKLSELEQVNEETQDSVDELAIDVSQQSNQKSANTFNPAIGMILNGQWLNSQNSTEYTLPGFFPAQEIGSGSEGFELGESELNLSANVDDKFYASATIAFGDGAEVEEAFIQTLNLGHGFNVKAGRFFSDIGYLTNKHSHTDDFSNRPLPYQAFLGGQFGDMGIQATWLAPTDIYWETGSEIYRGDSFPAAGASHSGNGLWTVFSHIGADIGDSMSWRAGLSYLNTDVEDRATDEGDSFTGKSALWIADFIYKWSPQGNRAAQELTIQGEYLARNEQGYFSDEVLNDAYIDTDQNGWYVEAVYRFSRQWRLGLRTSQLHSDDVDASFYGSILDPQGHTPKQQSLMLDWSNSEFSRIRLQVDHNDFNSEKDNVVILQYIAAFGAHGAHSF